MLFFKRIERGHKFEAVRRQPETLPLYKYTRSDT